MPTEWKKKLIKYQPPGVTINFIKLFWLYICIIQLKTTSLGKVQSTGNSITDYSIKSEWKVLLDMQIEINPTVLLDKRRIFKLMNMQAFCYTPLATKLAFYRQRILNMSWIWLFVKHQRNVSLVSPSLHHPIKYCLNIPLVQRNQKRFFRLVIPGLMASRK